MAAAKIADVPEELKNDDGIEIDPPKRATVSAAGAAAEKERAPPRPRRQGVVQRCPSP